MSDSAKPSVLQIAAGMATAGLTSVGGAAGPLRHVVVKQQKWLSEGEFAEYFGLAQALPGATAVNFAVIMSDRFAGAFGLIAALFGLIVPSLLLAIALYEFAAHLVAVNPKFAAVEVAVTAAVAGIFISNGVRLIWQIWADARDVQLLWRSARFAISAFGIVLVAALHVLVPIAMAIMIVFSLYVETHAGNGLKVPPVVEAEIEA